MDLVRAAQRRREAEHEHRMATVVAATIEHEGRSADAVVRLLLVRVRKHGWAVSRAAAAAGVSDRTAYAWLARDR